MAGQSMRTRWWVAGAVVALVVVIGGAFLVAQGQDSDDSDVVAAESSATPSEPSEPAVTTEPAPSVPTVESLACESDPSPTAGPDQVLIYLWCGPDYVPVVRDLKGDADRYAETLALLEAGPTADEKTRGYERSVSPDWPKVITVRDGVAEIDYTGAKTPEQLFLAGIRYNLAYRHTFEQFAEIDEVEVMLRGTPLCEVDPECMEVEE